MFIFLSFLIALLNFNSSYFLGFNFTDSIHIYMFSFLNVLAEMIFVFLLIILYLSFPVFALVSLILVFASVAFFYILLGLEFLGLILIIVYIGAIIVLFLFIVMLVPSDFSVKNSQISEVSFLTYFIFAFFGFEYLPFIFNFVNFLVWFLFIFYLICFNLDFLSFGVLTTENFSLTNFGMLQQIDNPSQLFSYYEILSTFPISSKQFLEFFGTFVYTEYWHLIIIIILILLVAMVAPILLLLGLKDFIYYKDFIFFKFDRAPIVSGLESVSSNVKFERILKKHY